MCGRCWRLPPILRRCRQTQANIYILALVRDCFWHTDCTFHILSYLCWRVWRHENAGQKCSWELFALTVSQTKPVLVKYTMGSIQIRAQEQGLCQWGQCLSSCEGRSLGFPISILISPDSCFLPLLVPLAVHDHHYLLKGPYSFL
jgi:hypothetical protein